MKTLFSRITAFILASAVLLCAAAISSPAQAADTQPEEVFQAAQELTAEAQAEGAEFDGYIFKLKDDVMTVMDADSQEGIESVEDVENVYAAQELEQIAEALPSDAIEYIEPDYIFTLDSSVSAPDDRYYARRQWNIGALNIPGLWALGMEGDDLDGLTDLDGNGTGDDDDMVIAVIDSGLKEGHEDIDYSRVLAGKNFLDESSDSTDDTFGHGTFCTGMIMATKNNSVGIAGICQSVYVMPLKVFDATTSKVSLISSAVNYAAGQRELFNSDHTKGVNIGVINLSFGGPSNTRTLKAAVERAIRAGIIVVCAAGNDGDTTAGYPAQYAIGVGSTDSDGSVSDFSQRMSSSNGTGYENKVWVTAPGGNVYSLGVDSTRSYTLSGGTSFSAPEVTALAALCKSIDNTMDHYAFKSLLRETAVYSDSGEGDIGGQDVAYGWGQVDFAATVNALIQNLGGQSSFIPMAKNSDGEPVEGASFTVYAADESGAAGEVVAAGSDGSYSLERTGSYIYEASAYGYKSTRGIFIPIKNPTALSVILEREPLISVTFDVTDEGGDPIMGADVVLTDTDGEEITQNSDGSFSVLPGEYLYSVTAQGYVEASGSVTAQAEALVIPVNLYESHEPLAITVQPGSASAPAGSAASFSVTATGTGLAYQWQYNASGTWKNVGTSINGYNAETMTFTAAAKYNRSQYRCVVTVAAGSKVTSDTATLTVK
ncbi:MAG: S8 family serine peptidase, partial [Oscillospiraceae bacterium]|nr:S8 family serine peptidase [Oscillospiraceae bacterium]